MGSSRSPWGAHRNVKKTAEGIASAIAQALEELKGHSPDTLQAMRYEKLRSFGAIGT